jgi:hypothetical protein
MGHRQDIVGRRVIDFTRGMLTAAVNVFGGESSSKRSMEP